MLPPPIPNLEIAATSTREALLAVHYVNRQTANALVTQGPTILGIVGFGAGRPSFLPDSCPFIAAPMSPASGDAVFEIWTACSACRPVKFGAVAGGYNDDVAFGAVELDEAGSANFEAAVETAYLAIFDFLDSVGFAAPIRFWNYLTAITKDDDGLDRYRRFNIGRQRAFASRLRQPLPPAASGVGAQRGTSIIYVLAAHDPAAPLENARQISAYSYPPVYGPSSPNFSRASIHRLKMGQSMFISGTASITGHESRHAGDLRGQIAETIQNLQTLIDASQIQAAPGGDPWAFKTYLNDPADRDAVDLALKAAFGSRGQFLYLGGDMCRSELLVEIEAFRHFPPPAPGR